MRIEVLVGHEDPIVYPLNSSKLTVGSAENCEIIISADGVSRKHLIIYVEGDQFYVADQGSTNGSFINEERLVPGRKAEFTSFFPVRLGDNVLLTLLSDDEESEGISFAELSKKEPSKIKISQSSNSGSGTIRFSTEAPSESIKIELQKKKEIRKKATTAKVSAAPSKKSKTNFVPVASVLIVLAAGYYNFFILKPSSTEDLPVSEVGKVIKVETPAQVEVAPVNHDLVKETEAPNKQTFLRLKNDIKCTTTGEAYLCAHAPGASESGYGVVQSGLTYHVFINADQYVAEAKPYLKDPKWDDPESVRDYSELLYLATAYVYLYRHLPVLDEAKVGVDAKVAIGFFRTGDKDPVIEKVVVFYPKVFNRLKPQFNENLLLYLKKSGRNAFDDFRNAFYVY